MSKSDYHDFKPILAEIEERPTNPLGTYFLWTIISLMIIVLLTIFLVKIDVVVSARGKIIPIGDVKVIQPLETGVITRIHIKEGDYVKKGDMLLEIDPSVDTADLEGKERNLSYPRLSMERINAVLNEKDFSPGKKDRASEIVRAQMTHYEAQRDVYNSTLKEKEKESLENQSALESLKTEIETINKVLAITLEDEKRQKALVEIGTLADNRYREKMKERMNLERERDSKGGQVQQLETKLARISDEIQTFKSNFREKLLSDYSNNIHERNTLEAEVSSLKFKQGKRFIIAPVTGYIHLLPVKTIGGVVTTAQPIVGIVPEGTPLEVNAIVMNKDIGYVKEGQSCVVKVDTYDFQKYGTIEGKVEIINPYSMEEKENKGTNKSAENESGGYPVRVKMTAETLKTKNGDVYKVKPGMSATVEVNVGKRRVIEFFLFPIIRYLDEGLKVR
ncbi:MAG: HlyD family type I secretion periplasmic adaptor subunit [Deltaproteobacteria bacterium]|nr:HlyD family type I secretion periplasmic adaptor subunit [Deltaproteobacteria bacterium]